jgi:hypothetical protein
MRRIHALWAQRFQPKAIWTLTNIKAVAYGMGLGSLLIFMALPSLDVGIGALPYFLQDSLWLFRSGVLAVQLGLSGLIAGWVGYATADRVEARFVRVAWVTVVSTFLLMLAALLISATTQPLTAQSVEFHIKVLPIAGLLVGPPWGLIFIWLAGSERVRGRPTQVPGSSA